MFGKGDSSSILFNPGSQGEWDAWDTSGFDQVSNQGIMDTPTDWGTLLGSQGGGGGMQMQQAQQQQQPNPLNTLSSLMGMVGKPQQQPRPGQAYQSPYIQSLMNI